MICYHELKEREGNGLLSWIEKKEERKMICYSKVKGGRKEDGLLFWIVVNEERKMVCNSEL